MGINGKKQGLFIVMVVASIMLFALPAWAAWPATAPTEAQWIPVMYTDWSYMRDNTGDSATAFTYSDVINYFAHPSGAGAYWWFDGTNIYLRMVVDGNPIVRYPATGTTFYHYGLVEEYYHVGIDATGDGNYEWYISIDGEGNTENKISTRYTEERVYTQYNLAADRNTDGETGWFVAGTGHPYESPAGSGIFYAIQDHVRISIAPGQTQNGTPDYFIDYWVPYTWLSRPGQTLPTPLLPCSPIRMIYGSANHTQHICDDLVGSVQGAYGLTDYQIEFSKNNYASLCRAPYGGYGVLADGRNIVGTANSGTWNPGDQLTVSGNGWPINTSAYYNSGYGAGVRRVRITGPGGDATVRWQGNVTTNASGVVATGTLAWPIPLNAAAGIYTILVENPRTAGDWMIRDTFTVALAEPDIATSTKTATAKNKITGTEVLGGPAIEGDTIIYTITVRNSTGNTIYNLTLTDSIPDNTTYVAGSTTMGGSALADVSGTSRLVSGYGPFNLAANASLVFTFRVTLNVGVLDQTKITNTAIINYKGTNTQKIVETTVNAPMLNFTKSTNKEYAVPGEVITYTITITNIGSSEARTVECIDVLPLEVTYVPGSLVLPPSGTFTYQHVTGGAYDSSNSIPITGIKYNATSLAPGASITYKFQAIVK